MQQLHFLFKFRDQFKNAEVFTSSDQRDQVSIDTTSEELLLQLIKNEDARIIIINGSAGSGKTFLIDRVRDKLEADINFFSIEDKSASKKATKSCLVIKDITALNVEAIKKFISITNEEKYSKIVVCVNFGPLLEYSRSYDKSVFSKAMQVLRRPNESSYNENLPTVINLNDYRVIDKTNVKLIFETDYVLNTLLKELDNDSLILRTWNQLKDDKKIGRLFELITKVNLVKEDWSFRELWYFIEDLFNQSENKNHSIYHRLFFSKNKISKSLLKLCDPVNIPMGYLDDYCWHEDIIEINKILPNVFLTPNISKEDKYLLLKLQILFLHSESWLIEKVNSDNIDIHKRKKLVQKINSFCSFGDNHDRSLLNLYINSRIEIRDTKYPGYFTYGNVPVQSLSLFRHKFILNCPSFIEEQSIKGSRLYFKAGIDGSPYHIPPDFINELDKDNSLLYGDRSVSDLETSLELMSYKFLNENKDLEVEMTSNVKKQYPPMNVNEAEYLIDN